MQFGVKFKSNQSNANATFIKIYIISYPKEHSLKVIV